MLRSQALDKSLRKNLAEGEGFEPSIRLKTVWRFSKPLPSTARPPLQVKSNVLVQYTSVNLKNLNLRDVLSKQNVDANILEYTQVHNNTQVFYHTHILL